MDDPAKLAQEFADASAAAAANPEDRSLADRRDALQARLAAALSPPKSETILNTGSGAVAKDGGVSAGRGGVAVGGSTGPIFVRNEYQGEPPEDAEKALAIYRESVVRACRFLPLAGLDRRAADATAQAQQPELSRIYVDLDVRGSLPEIDVELADGKLARVKPDERMNKPVSALKAIAANRRAVILGQPGAGKSTFVNHLCLCLAKAEPPEDWLAKEMGAIPIRVILRDLAAALPSNPDVCDVWDFVVGRLKKQNLDFAADPLAKALDDGSAVVVFDGLDEIPDRARRTAVRDCLAAFAARYGKCRLIVTCRTLSYQDDAWRLPEEEFETFELAEFDEAKIDRFIGAWYDDLAQSGRLPEKDPAALAADLRAAVRRPDLWRLAPTPLLLTVMAHVHAHRGRLPDARALLYEEVVDLLLWHWDDQRAGAGDAAPMRRLITEAGCAEVDLKIALARLAFEAHQRGGTEEGTADIGVAALQRELRALHPDRSLDWVEEVIEAMRQRAGLLHERDDGIYAFPHRTFQEYLAGSDLARDPDFTKRAAKLADEGDLWRQVILLAVGNKVYLKQEVPIDLVGELCPARQPTSQKGWRRAWLAGEILLEIGVERASRIEIGKEILTRVRTRLAKLLEKGALEPKERAAAGAVLGRLGDPRPGVGVIRGKNLPDIRWSEEIPPGPFPMGNDKGESSYGVEEPRFECRLIGGPYRIAIYPITVAQYRLFEEAGGYRERAFWTEAGWEWISENKINGPEAYGGDFECPNHPRVGVSWYEAHAFCEWLSRELGQTVGLPSEAQWERAARHTDARLYPWGNDAKDAHEHCNIGASGIGATCAVGSFPSGASPCGAADLSGNVLEWCQTQWRDGYRKYAELADDNPGGANARVLRGGAFYYDPVFARCAYRGWYFPHYRRWLIGFRVVSPPVLRFP